jgi:hypothetical protein
MNSNALTIEKEVLRWPGVTKAPGRFGAVAFRYGEREIGHLQRDDRIANLPVTPQMCEDLLSEGRARPHKAGAKGYVSYPIRDQEDVSVILEILGLNYDRAKAATEDAVGNREVKEERE